MPHGAVGAAGAGRHHGDARSARALASRADAHSRAARRLRHASDLGPVRFVPLIGVPGAAPGRNGRLGCQPRDLLADRLLRGIAAGAGRSRWPAMGCAQPADGVLDEQRQPMPAVSTRRRGVRDVEAPVPPAKPRRRSKRARGRSVPSSIAPVRLAAPTADAGNRGAVRAPSRSGTTHGTPSRAMAYRGRVVRLSNMPDRNKVRGAASDRLRAVAADERRGAAGRWSPRPSSPRRTGCTGQRLRSRCSGRPRRRAGRDGLRAARGGSAASAPPSWSG